MKNLPVKCYGRFNLSKSGRMLRGGDRKKIREETGKAGFVLFLLQKEKKMYERGKTGRQEGLDEK